MYLCVSKVTTILFNNCKDLPENFVQIFRGPTKTSNWLIPGRVLMSAFPGDHSHAEAQSKISSILDAGIETFVCLQENSELKYFEHYWPHVQKLAKTKKHFLQFEIPDLYISDVALVEKFTNELVQRFHQGDNFLIHCRMFSNCDNDAF